MHYIKKMSLFIVEDFIKATMLWVLINYFWIYITPRLPELAWAECVAITVLVNTVINTERFKP
jgi:hypothetical protein